MDYEVDKTYVLQDIMKKRRKDQEAVENKIRNKIALKNKRKQRTIIHAPEKFIKQYRAQQKSYAYLKNKKRVAMREEPSSKNNSYFKKLIVAVRIRGVTDISLQQKAILRKLNLRQVNSATFIKGTKANIQSLKLIENYVTYGEPSKKLIRQLIYKKMYGNVNKERIQIKSNEQVEQHIGGDVICLEDIVEEITNLGSNFTKIMEFIYPFKLTTIPGTLASRLRKPVENGGHWGDRGEEINQYVSNMI